MRARIINLRRNFLEWVFPFCLKCCKWRKRRLFPLEDFCYRTSIGFAMMNSIVDNQRLVLFEG